MEFQLITFWIRQTQYKFEQKIDLSKLLSLVPEKATDFFNVKVTNGNHEFNSHKLILQQLSPVFKRILSNRMIFLPDISDDALKVLETLIYTEPKSREN